MGEVASLLPDSYQGSRARFGQSLERARAVWPEARLAAHRVEGDGDLTIDSMEAEAAESRRKRPIVTSGQHGVEAYVGAAILQLFRGSICRGWSPRPPACSSSTPSTRGAWNTGGARTRHHGASGVLA